MRTVGQGGFVLRDLHGPRGRVRWKVRRITAPVKGVGLGIGAGEVIVLPGPSGGRHDDTARHSRWRC